MNSIERVVAAVGLNEVDRVPVIAQVFGHSAVFSKIPLGEYLRDGEKLAKCQIKALKHYDYDAVFALMDVNVETESMGSILKYNDNDYATIEKYAIDEKTDLDKLKLPNPEKDGRMPEILKAVKILKKEVGDDVVVVGNSLGPLTIATQLIGMEKALYLAVDEPDKFQKILDFSTELCITFATAQIQAGAHLPVIFEPSASPAVIPPQFFREFELPCLKKVFTKLKEAGAAANWLHIAGPVQKILPFYPEAGVNISNFDFCVTPEEATTILPEMCFDGNIKPYSFEVDTPEQITNTSKKVINHFSERGGLILSSGCEIPPNSKVENIEAMVQAVRS